MNDIRKLAGEAAQNLARIEVNNFEDLRQEIVAAMRPLYMALKRERSCVHNELFVTIDEAFEALAYAGLMVTDVQRRAEMTANDNADEAA